MLIKCSLFIICQEKKIAQDKRQKTRTVLGWQGLMGANSVVELAWLQMVRASLLVFASLPAEALYPSGYYCLGWDPLDAFSWLPSFKVSCPPATHMPLLDNPRTCRLRVLSLPISLSAPPHSILLITSFQAAPGILSPILPGIQNLPVTASS